MASILVTTAGLLGSYVRLAVAGRSGQAGAVASDSDPYRRRHIGSGMARPSKEPTRPRKETAPVDRRVRFPDIYSGAPNDVRSGGK